MGEERDMSYERAFGILLLVVAIVAGGGCSPPRTAADEDVAGAVQAPSLAQLAAEQWAAEAQAAEDYRAAAAAEIAALEAEQDARDARVAAEIQAALDAAAAVEAEGRAYAERLPAAEARARLQCLIATNAEFDAIYGYVIAERNDIHEAIYNERTARGIVGDRDAIYAEIASDPVSNREWATEVLYRHVYGTNDPFAACYTAIVEAVFGLWPGTL
jgi:hypothetical protein